MRAPPQPTRRSTGRLGLVVAALLLTGAIVLLVTNRLLSTSEVPQTARPGTSTAEIAAPAPEEPTVQPVAEPVSALTDAPVANELEPSEARTTIESKRRKERFARGRVLMLPDKKPFAGVTVRLSTGVADIAFAVTDDEGSFKIPNTKNRGRRLHFDLPAGWACEDNPRRLGVQTPRGHPHVQVEAFPLLSAPVVGYILDEVSGAGFEGFVVRVKNAEHDEVVLTDANGRFETREAFASGPMTWYQKRDKDSDSRGTRIFEGVHVGEEVTCTVRVGPTYRLRISPAEAVVGDLEARLVHPVAIEHGESWVKAKRADTVSIQSADSMVQFLPFEDADERTRLTVSSRSSGWSGTAEVPPGTGVHPTPIDLTLARQASIQIFVESELPHEARCSLEDSYGRRSWSQDARSWVVPAGPYTITLTDRRHEPWTRTLDAKPGLNRVVARLAPRAIGGTVAGEIHRRSGERGAVPFMQVELQPADSDEPPLLGSPEWDGAVASFAIQNVPTGDYRLSVKSPLDLRWTQSSIEVSPPQSGIVLVWEDDIPTADWKIKLVSAETGKRLKGEILLWQGGASDTWFGRGRRPIDSEFRFSVRVDGYESYWGDHTLFVDVPSERRPTREATIALRPGWSARVVAQDTAGDPIAGVDAVAASGVLGTTDEHGIAILHQSEDPGRLTFEHSEYRLIRYRQQSGVLFDVTMTPN